MNENVHILIDYLGFPRGQLKKPVNSLKISSFNNRKQVESRYVDNNQTKRQAEYYRYVRVMVTCSNYGFKRFSLNRFDEHVRLQGNFCYQESERLTCLCQTIGHRLVTAIANMGNARQERTAIAEFLDDSDIKCLLQDASRSLEGLERHARWLNENRFVMYVRARKRSGRGETPVGSVIDQQFLTFCVPPSRISR